MKLSEKEDAFYSVIHPGKLRYLKCRFCRVCLFKLNNKNEIIKRINFHKKDCYLKSFEKKEEFKSKENSKVDEEQITSTTRDKKEKFQVKNELKEQPQKNQFLETKRNSPEEEELSSDFKSLIQQQIKNIQLKLEANKKSGKDFDYASLYELIKRTIEENNKSKIIPNWKCCIPSKAEEFSFIHEVANSNSNTNSNSNRKNTHSNGESSQSDGVIPTSKQSAQMNIVTIKEENNKSKFEQSKSVGFNMPLTQIINESKKYTFKQIIGGSLQVKVSKCIEKSTNKEVIIKSTQLTTTNLERGIQLFRKMAHENMVKARDSFELYNTYNFVFDSYAYDLSDVIYNLNPSITDLINIFSQILQVLDYFQKNNFSHSNLNPSNVLLNQKEGKFKAAITDLDCTCKFKDKDIFPLSYKPPELLLGLEETSKSADMWSFGCLVAESFAKNVFFKGINEEEVLHSIELILGSPTKDDLKSMNLSFFSQKNERGSGFTGLFIDMEKKERELFINLISNILVYNPRKRLTPSQTLSHPFFQIVL